MIHEEMLDETGLMGQYNAIVQLFIDRIGMRQGALLDFCDVGQVEPRCACIEDVNVGCVRRCSHPDI